MTTDLMRAAFNQGCSDYYSGKSLFECPYADTDARMEMWYRGYRHAKSNKYAAENPYCRS